MTDHITFMKSIAALSVHDIMKHPCSMKNIVTQKNQVMASNFIAEISIRRVNHYNGLGPKSVYYFNGSSLRYILQKYPSFEKYVDVDAMLDDYYVYTVYVVTPNSGGYSELPWVISSCCKCCMICNLEFDFFNWSHHCRACGDLVCDNCSKDRGIVELLDTNTTHRLCVDCYIGPGLTHKLNFKKAHKAESRILMKSSSPTSKLRSSISRRNSARRKNSENGNDQSTDYDGKWIDQKVELINSAIVYDIDEIYGTEEAGPSDSAESLDQVHSTTPVNKLFNPVLPRLNTVIIEDSWFQLKPTLSIPREEAEYLIEKAAVMPSALIAWQILLITTTDDIDTPGTVGVCTGIKYKDHCAYYKINTNVTDDAKEYKLLGAIATADGDIKAPTNLQKDEMGYYPLRKVFEQQVEA